MWVVYENKHLRLWRLSFSNCVISEWTPYKLRGRNKQFNVGLRTELYRREKISSRYRSLVILQMPGLLYPINLKSSLKGIGILYSTDYNLPVECKSSCEEVT